MGQLSRRARWGPLLRDAQDGICPYCGEPLPEKGATKAERCADWDSGRIATLDHVYPRAREPWRGHQGNLLLVHRTPCNEDKKHDMPTGCQVIWLHAINARLGVTLTSKPPRNWQGLDRKPAGTTVGPQSATIGDAVARPVLTRREQARRPAVLGLLDDCFAGMRSAYAGRTNGRLMSDDQ